MKQYCPVCGELVCPPHGSSPDLLIVGEKPGPQEMIKGYPFATHDRFITAGKIFRKELELVGLSLSDFRVMNLWLHEPTDSEDCYRAGYNLVLNEAKGKKAILLVGSDTVEAFTQYKVSEVSGLQVDSPTLSAPLIMAMVNPALAEHRGVGEVRQAIQKWHRELKKEGLI